MPQLIINADDYGLTPGVNRSIEELFAARALTSATLMANAPATEAAAAFCCRHPQFGVGCHVVLVDGTPLAPASTSLTPPGHTRFFGTLATLLRALARQQISETDIQHEATLQIRRLQQLGVHVDHVDTHKHTHMFPRILRPLLRAAAECGVRAIRNPFEPSWSVRRTLPAGLVRGLQVTALRARFRSSFLRLVENAGFTTTDGCLGVAATGTLTAPFLRRLLPSLPDGTWELVCHPGYPDADLAAITTRLQHSRGIEHQALLQALPAHANLHRSFRHLLTTA